MRINRSIALRFLYISNIFNNKRYVSVYAIFQQHLLRYVDAVARHLHAKFNAVSLRGDIIFIQNGGLDTVGDRILSQVVNINLIFVFGLPRFPLGRTCWSIGQILARRALAFHGVIGAIIQSSRFLLRNVTIAKLLDRRYESLSNPGSFLA